jgi:hypothetical protein
LDTRTRLRRARHRRDRFRRDVNRVDAREAFAQQAFGIEQRHGRAAVFFNTRAHFCWLLGDVHVNRKPRSFAKLMIVFR